MQSHRFFNRRIKPCSKKWSCLYWHNKEKAIHLSEHLKAGNRPGFIKTFYINYKEERIVIARVHFLLANVLATIMVYIKDILNFKTMRQSSSTSQKVILQYVVGYISHVKARCVFFDLFYQTEYWLRSIGDSQRNLPEPNHCHASELFSFSVHGLHRGEQD